MTIALIIPTFNEEQALPRTLANAHGTHMDEVIVVDGGSRDRTTEVAETFFQQPRPYRTCVLTSPAGRAIQMNAGATAAQSDVLLFLHADTLLPPDARTAITEALTDPRTVWGRFDVQFDSNRRWARVISRMMNLRSRWSKMATGDQAIFVRRAIFHRLGGFSAIPLMEDLDLSHRLKRTGDMAALRNTVTTSFRRWEQQGPLRTVLRMWTLRLLYWMGVSPQRLDRFYATIR